MRVVRERDRPELPVDAPDVAPVAVAVGPRLDPPALGPEVHPAQHRPDAHPGRRPDEERVDRVVRRDLAVGRRRPEERELKVAEALPVEDVRREVDPQPVERLLDVGDGELRVPAVVEVDRERPQAQLAREVGDVRAVDAARDADHAVVVAPAAGLPGPVDASAAGKSSQINLSF